MTASEVLGEGAAPLPRRLAAALYEGLLLLALVLVLGFALLPLTASSGGTALQLPGRAARSLSLATTFLALGAYCTYFWSRGRRSLPMKTWHLRLVDRRGAALTPARAALRYVACWAGPVLALATYSAVRGLPHARAAAWALALNFAWALVDRDRLFLHDRLARTRMIIAT